MMVGSSPFSEEPLSGFPRVIRLGQQIFVSGSTSANQYGRIRGPEDPHAQTLFALENVESALATVGADRAQIIAVRAYVTDAAAQSDKVRTAHGEFFAGAASPPLRIQEFRPADPLILVEIEADAVILP